MNNKNLTLGIVLGILVPVGVLASNLTLPFTFSAGTPIRASEVNANFAAVQTAVNSKLDVTASPVHGGTRLKIETLNSADGLSMLYQGTSYLYDSQLNTYCYPYYRATDGVQRCLPLGVNQGGYSDSGCTRPVYIATGGDHGPNSPADSFLYTNDIAAGVVTVHTAVSYSGPLYVKNGTSCLTTTTAQPMFQAGSVVSPSTFAQMTSALY